MQRTQSCTSVATMVKRTRHVTLRYVKGNVLPRTGHEGPEREPPTSALDGGGWSKPRFIPGKDPVSIVWEAGWASEPAWTGAENLALHWDLIPGPSSP